MALLALAKFVKENKYVCKANSCVYTSTIFFAQFLRYVDGDMENVSGIKLLLLLYYAYTGVPICVSFLFSQDAHIVQYYKLKAFDWRNR